MNAPELLRLQGAGKFFEGGVPVVALHPSDLVVQAGEFTCLCGPSGSGKTTLLNLAGALERPSVGEVTLMGRPLSGLSRREAALLRLESVGIVFQAYNLLPVLSARENVEYPLLLKRLQARERRELTEKALEAVGLAGKADRKPSELSGGEQQRVAVARAIAGSPRLVLADEPTANLDGRTGEALVELFRELNERLGLCFLFSTHDERIIRRARRLVEMRDGRIVGDHPAAGM